VSTRRRPRAAHGIFSRRPHIQADRRATGAAAASFGWRSAPACPGSFSGPPGLPVAQRAPGPLLAWVRSARDLRRLDEPSPDRRAPLDALLSEATRASVHRPSGQPKQRPCCSILLFRLHRTACRAYAGLTDRHSRLDTSAASNVTPSRGEVEA